MRIRRKKAAAVRSEPQLLAELRLPHARAETVDREERADVDEVLRSGGLDRFVTALANVLLADLERHGQRKVSG